MKHFLFAASLLILLSCNRSAEDRAAGTGDQLSGTVTADGSSTVFPISEAVAEEFQKVHPDVRVTVGISGTGGGFKKFCGGETDLSNASRPIKPTEVEQCGEEGLEYIELPIAYDGIAIVVNPQNDWASHITTEELRRLWEPAAQGKIMRWSQVRPGWPDQEIHLYGAGVDSGTFDYFSEAINGEEGASRGDFTASEDDNVLVQGVATDPNALGFFGYAYYGENSDKLKLLPVDDGNEGNGAGPIAASPEAIGDGTYQPLSRPIFIYISPRSLERPEVARFVEFYLEEAPELVAEVGYIPLPGRSYDLARARVADRKTGSLFARAGSQVGVSIEDLLAQDGVQQGGEPEAEEGPVPTGTGQ